MYTVGDSSVAALAANSIEILPVDSQALTVL